MQSNTITTHAKNSPVCDRCRRKSQAWFVDFFPLCEETGQAPIFIQIKVKAEKPTKDTRIGSKGGAFSNKKQKDVSS